MTERRSGRAKKQMDYSKLDGESDEDFFDVNLKTTKRKQTKDEEWNENREAKVQVTKSNPKPPVTKKLPLKAGTSPAIVRVVALEKENRSPCTKTSVSCNVVSTHRKPEIHSKVDASVSNVSESSSPTSSVCRASPSYAVTPTSGLRLGLSRTQKLKPLHRNIRISY
ncbi:hypothetical protein FBUS_08609 [Fasciolopsis buskii]|uniref:RAD51 interacting motif domain-containing protein n=1 Tax=Fasciolopsis buskii TaxID=27845 RepID=A0A8E0VIA0_9TREM|nr:hypothetical protein FBUS_08609 [Fasciolopsis buski]